MNDIKYDADPLSKLGFLDLHDDMKYEEYWRVSRRMQAAESALRVKKILVGELKMEKKALTREEENRRLAIKEGYAQAGRARHAATNKIKLEMWEIYVELRDAGEKVRSKTLIDAYEIRHGPMTYLKKTKENPDGIEKEVELKTVENWFSQFNKDYDLPSII